MRISVRKKLKRIILFLTLGILSGSLTGIFFVILKSLMSLDSLLTLSEFFVLLLSPIIASLIIFKIFHSSLVKTTLISTFTLIIPILGASFGAKEYVFLSELGIFSLIGGIGGFLWSIPYAIFLIFKKQ